MASSVADEEDMRIFDEISNYYRDAHIRELFKDYLKRLMVSQPQDPIAYLQKQIKTNPFIPPESSQSTVQNIIYYSRNDFTSPKLFSDIINKMPRFKESDLWLDLMSSDEVMSVSRLLSIDPPLTERVTTLIQNFLLRHNLSLDMVSIIINFFDKAREFDIKVHALDDNDISLFPYTSDELSYIDKVKYIVEKVDGTWTNRYIKKINEHGGLKSRPQIIFASVEHVPHLKGGSVGYVHETIGKLKIYYGPRLDIYLSFINNILSDINSGNLNISEEEEAYIRDCKRCLQSNREKGYADRGIDL
mmetsp:Transcript_41161/g.42060  ORF Transcript_41161/g.42060 Transcript_41161/m.42060 type:complete len:303 (+) Transcript_41161:104-1012(+)